MNYEIFQYPEADEDILDAINYYSQSSRTLASSFENQLSLAYEKLEKNPYFQIRYEDIRGLMIKKFPYLILFYINEEIRTVNILSVFCTHQNPEKYP